MIGEFLLDIVFGIVEGILYLLPDIAWTVDNANFEAFANIIRMVAFLLPWDTVGQIASIIISIIAFKTIISLVKTIWEILPIV